MKLKLKNIDLYMDGTSCDEEFDIIKHYSCEYNQNIEDVYELKDQYNKEYFLFTWVDQRGQWEISETLFGIPIETGTAEILEIIK